MSFFNIIDRLRDFVTDDKLKGIYLASPTGKLLDEDKSWIQIEIFGKKRYAKPSMPFGWTFVPNKKWLEKHKDEIALWVIFENGDSRYPVWVGVAQLDDIVPDGNYPNTAFFKTSEFYQKFDDDEKKFTLKNSTDDCFILAENYISLLNKDKYGTKFSSDGVEIGKDGEGKTEAVRYKELEDIIKDILEMVVKMQTISPIGNNSTGELDPATMTRKQSIENKLSDIKSKSVKLD